MKGSFVVFSFLCIVIFTVSEAKVFTRCELSKELNKLNFPRSFLSNWVCLVESESERTTSKMTGPLPNGSYSYGIFQINSKKWCARGRKGGICNKRCEDFLNDDISDDSQCARKVFNELGFQGWQGWQKKCRGKPLPDISRCL
ncbi:lysozyme-like [Ctenocephalides felis]|uniref:lysozyme-like n=1 Tax=Ctenocephalides felis TaxID=7515 RepID=UPI000E6E1B6F|nr:lysozyme-like [Ctenocephalides felis]